jgi:hypothetical protein
VPCRRGRDETGFEHAGTGEYGQASGIGHIGLVPFNVAGVVASLEFHLEVEDGQSTLLE